MRARVIGGTDPTGPFIVQGLRKRGYDVATFHRGTHEIPEIPADVEHIHGDPHSRETIDTAIASRSFDLVVTEPEHRFARRRVRTEQAMMAAIAERSSAGEAQPFRRTRIRAVAVATSRPTSSS